MSSLYYVKSQIVLSSVEGSPGARAGIHTGDELVEIDGKAAYVFLFFFSRHASFPFIVVDISFV